ncbi:MAG: hypothetical protein BMS9Abin34_005 [Patescibacteria group bacterium]|nr:MAG: hypothetical protein BMS9Abin34_005 [Patescibacteria group bacterium]
MNPEIASNANSESIASDRKIASNVNSENIAYVSSEFALTDDLPTYAGGLGVLAGDILYQAAESKIPMAGITVFYREGFFQQLINPEGRQQHFYESIQPEKAGLVDTGQLIKIPLVNHEIYLKIWRKDPSASSGQAPSFPHAPLYLLDADTPENRPEDRKITDRLYERVWAPHLTDDLVLGIGSVRLARKLRLPIQTWHINDDHGALNIMERLREYIAQGAPLDTAREKVKAETIFTTHTPVAGAESKFPKKEIFPVLTALFAGVNVDLEAIYELGKRMWGEEEVFSLSVFAMRLARATNAVSKKHFKVSQKLWGFIPNLPLSYVTNGVYAPRWTPPELKDTYQQNSKTDDKNLWEGKLAAKNRVAVKLSQAALDGKTFDPEALVLCWARRFAKYKQPTLLTSDLDRLAKILSSQKMPAYLLISGKAHPEDPEGQEFVTQVIKASRDPRIKDRLIYLPNYSLTLAHDLLAAADVWLNTPVVGWEASGTSGMKAVYNSALNASTLDGWWLEGFQPAKGGRAANGWVIEPDGEDYAGPAYALLENEIIPLYHRRENNLPRGWVAMIKEAYNSCGEKFDTKRMINEYNKLYSSKK